MYLVQIVQNCARAKHNLNAGYLIGLSAPPLFAPLLALLIVTTTDPRLPVPDDV